MLKYKQTLLVYNKDITGTHTNAHLMVMFNAGYQMHIHIRSHFANNTLTLSRESMTETERKVVLHKLPITISHNIGVDLLTTVSLN